MNFLSRYFRRSAASLLLLLAVQVSALTALAQAQPLRLGVMLPLHDENGDGRRMVEYYRGVLMACDSLKSTGLSVDIHAWNTPEDSDLKDVLRDPAAARCDLIIGPLYSRQVRALSDFVAQHGIKLLIPFSITAPALYTNPNIYQVYQNNNDFNNASVAHYLKRFSDCHPVIIDCNDSTSKKGSFTFTLRRKLDERGISYNLTNLKSSEEAFSKAFSSEQRNVVILNTGRHQELGVALAKLDGLRTSRPDLQVSMFGYTEWLGYTSRYLEKFYRYDVYIPSAFYTNVFSSQTQRMQQKYRANFRQDMQQMLPRLAITGFDQAMFFLRGLRQYGKAFNGEASQPTSVKPVQTPLLFERVADGGWRNRTHILVHYRTDQRVETIQ